MHRARTVTTFAAGAGGQLGQPRQLAQLVIESIDDSSSIAGSRQARGRPLGELARDHQRLGLALALVVQPVDGFLAVLQVMPEPFLADGQIARVLGAFARPPREPVANQDHGQAVAQR